MDIKQTFPFQIFRAYDIRGKLNVLTPERIVAIAHGLAQQYLAAGHTKLVLGYDARLTGPYYAALVQAVLGEHGLCVTNIGCCSTPLMYFTARSHDGNGIMITASHNPKTDNGIKWVMGNQPPSPEIIQQVGWYASQIRVDLSPYLHLQSTVAHQENTYFDRYEDALVQDIQLNHRFKIVLDGLHGSAGEGTRRLLQCLGCEVIAIRCEPNGHFPDHAPDPSQALHLQTLRQYVLAEQADLGIALDGDGDRLVVVDEHATIISADRLISLFSQLCLAAQPAHEVVFDVKCSTMVRNTILACGGQPTMIRTGSTFLRQYLAKSAGRAIFGGEYAGHYVFNDGRGYGFDDGPYAALRLLEYMAAHPTQSLSSLLAAYPERCSTEDLYINTYEANPVHVLQDIEAQGQTFQALLSRTDGIRLDFHDGFGILRASNTGEYFTARFDAETPQRLAEIKQIFVTMLQKKYPKLAHDLSQA